MFARHFEFENQLNGVLTPIKSGTIISSYRDLKYLT